jgi:pimeloyl-ACP methyl ester carboxylesterase
VCGSRLALLEAGQGDPVVLLHGFPDNAWTWEPVIERLALRGHRVVAPFLPGYWPSEPPPSGEIEVTEVIELLESLLGEIGDGPVALVGHDWGATLTYLLAGRAPRAISRAVTIAVPHPARSGALIFDPELAHHAFHWWLFLVDDIGEAALSANDLALVDYLWRQWSPDLEDRQHIERVKRETLGATGGIANAIGYYRSFLSSLAAGTLELPTITVPTLTVFGGDDPMRRLVVGQESAFAAAFRTETLPGAGHFVHREDPDRIALLIEQWIDEGAPGR